MVTLLSLVLVVFTVGLATPAAAAKDCRAATPLPDDLKIVAPAADVPAEAARFAGAWSGAWTDKGGAEVMCHTLVVEEANGYARVVYSHGSYAGWNAPHANFWCATGRVIDGELRVRLPLHDRPSVAYRFDGGHLAGRFNNDGHVKLTRVVDVAPLECGRAERAAPVVPPAGVRDRLGANELFAPAFQGTGPVHNDYFMPIGAVAPAKHALKGRLTFAPSSLSGSSRGCRSLPSPVSKLTVEFFTHGDRLVPVVRDIHEPPETVIFSPGRVWSEPGDGGLSRASFPFTVVNQVHNGAHNGLATFLFDDTRVSALRIQIVQETSAWEKFDFWGHLPMTYVPAAITNEGTLRAAFDEEIRRQTPMRPWSALPPSAALADFDGDAAPADISANGVVMDGILYVRGCHTRYGPFPYCGEMRHGVFSVTKSLGAAITLLRLAQKYGDAVLAEKITDYVPAARSYPAWEGVTFADALNMAVAIGEEAPTRDGSPTADDNGRRMTRLLLKRTAKEKLEVALSFPRYAWDHREVLRYNSAQTFMLAVAMDGYLKRREGSNAHLWDMVRTEVFRPLGILHAPKMHTLETDGSRGVPLLAYGLYPTVDDLAKLVTLLQNGGRHDGTQLLSAARLTEALYRGSVTVGLPTRARNRFGDMRYHLSFWSIPYRTATGCFFQIPYMAGYGGNLVALLPNGVSVFRFADGFNFDLDSMILAGESLRPFCTPPATAQATPPVAVESAPSATAATAPSRVLLTRTDLSTEIEGYAFTIGLQRIVFAAGGRLYGAMRDDVDVGSWTIRPEGQVCRTWNVWDNGRSRCYLLYKAGETFE